MGKSSHHALHSRSYKSSSNNRSDDHNSHREYDSSSYKQPVTEDADHFKDKYKYSKAMLKALEKKNDEITEELKLAQMQISRLQKQQSLYLNALVELQDPSDSDSDDSVPKPLYLSSQHKVPRLRVFKPYEFLPKRKPDTPKKAYKESPPLESIHHRPHTRRDPEVARRAQAVPVDETGSFILPAQVGIFTIYDLGVIDYERPAFHTKRYIMPIGLKISRYYRSTVNPDAQALYTSTIKDAGSGPQFEVIADDRPNEPFISETSSGAWTRILKLASQVRNLQVSNSGSGPEYIGLAHPSIAYMIQNLPNAEKCKEYFWQKFDIVASKPPKRKQPSVFPMPTSPVLSVPSNPVQDHDSSSVSPLIKEELPEGSSDIRDSPVKSGLDSDQPTPSKKFRIWD